MKEGEATIKGNRLFSIFHQKSAQDISLEVEGLVHYFSCTPWLPTAIFDPLVTIEAAGKKIFNLSFTSGETEVQGSFRLNADHSLQRIEWVVKGATTPAVKLDYSFEDYQEHDGHWIPFRYQCSRTPEKKTSILSKMQLVDLVYDEEFSWW